MLNCGDLFAVVCVKKIVLGMLCRNHFDPTSFDELDRGVYAVSYECCITKAKASASLKFSEANHVLFRGIFSIHPQHCVARLVGTQRRDRYIEPLQQRLIALLVEGAAQKKLSFSLAANSSKASAMPSWVRPSWLKRSCWTTQWPWVSRSRSPSAVLT